MGYKLGKKPALSFNEGWFLIWFGFNFVQLGMDMQHGSVWYGFVWYGPGLDLVWTIMDLVWYGLAWYGPGLV